MTRFDDPTLRDAITRDFLQGIHPAHIAAAHQLTLSDLLAWWDHPQVQSELASLRQFLEAQRHLATLAVAPECVAILMDVARRHPGAEAARKSASQLLRALGPAATGRDHAATHHVSAPPPAGQSVAERPQADSQPHPATDRAACEPRSTKLTQARPPLASPVQAEPWSSSLADELLSAPVNGASRLVCHDV